MRREEFCVRLQALTAAGAAPALDEVDASISRLFSYAAWADKFDGQVHTPPVRNIALAVNEPVGIIGIACPDEAPLLAFISLVAPAIALGNRCVVIPSQSMPLLATDFYQVIETSDVPDGVINILTGDRDALGRVLATTTRSKPCGTSAGPRAVPWWKPRPPQPSSAAGSTTRAGASGSHPCTCA